MARFHHGFAFNDNEVTPEAGSVAPNTHAAVAAQPATEQSRFGFLFPDLQKDTALVPKSAVEDLIALGKAMADTSKKDEPSRLPAVFTYFGQFIAHDITWEKGTKHITTVPDIQPWDPAQVEALVNKRSGDLDLDCVYGDATFKVPKDETTGTLRIDEISDLASIPSNVKDKDTRHDVPRTTHNLPPNPDTGRQPLIGDPRNDENTIISQLHVAFLRAHNKLVENNSFEDARKKLIQAYQTIVVKDYLGRIIRPDILSKCINQPDLYQKDFMPVEFSAAAFRFGHTMIRTSYELNENFMGASSLGLLMLFGMPPSTYHHLPGSWIIDWRFFTDGGSNLARPINTLMVEPLSLLNDSPDNPFKTHRRLAVRDLLRGYIFSLPTGQSIADSIVEKKEEILTAKDFQRLVPTAQWNVLSNSELLERTPLWFYILAEAAREKEKDPKNDFLGPVGSQIVAGVLIGLISRSPDSIFKNGFSPLGSLTDLFRFAGVLS